MWFKGLAYTTRATLDERFLTVAKALERSQAMEVASKEVRNFQLTER